jgi:MULE transposase domain
MSHKTQAQYTTMLEKVNEAYSKVFPNHNMSPDFVMLDCEIALKNALEATWPTTRTIMCYYHVMQAVLL